VNFNRDTAPFAMIVMYQELRNDHDGACAFLSSTGLTSTQLQHHGLRPSWTRLYNSLISHRHDQDHWAEYEILRWCVVTRANKTAVINFWATGVDPKQFNLGLAYYGTSYTMTDPSCTHIGCPATLAKVQSCSPQAGYLFNAEIPALAGKTEIDQNAMVKTMVYKGDQWVAYDDADTFKLKLGVSHLFRIIDEFRTDSFV
jgi:nitrite reductase/ring-hydroxylating ferredoxin subunit